MPLDHYVTLGRSGLRVSPLCLGALTFGEDLEWGSSVKESERIIDPFISRTASAEVDREIISSDRPALGQGCQLNASSPTTAPIGRSRAAIST